jgi:hypothetical protein
MKQNQQRLAADETRKEEGEKTFIIVKYARGSLDFILEIASRSITFKKIINKIKQKHFNYFM